jgi:hypothetical protein
MCSQYSAAEFPQRGDNPGTWRGSTPRGSRDRELQTHQVGKGRVAWRQTTGRRRLIGTGDALFAGLSEAGWLGVWLAQVSTGAGTSISAGLVRITTRDTTSARTANTAASWKAVEIP